MLRRTAILITIFHATACAPVNAPPPPPSVQPDPPVVALPAPPWRSASLRATDVPAPFRARWSAAQNRATCALIAPASVGAAGAGATARAATFSGGWAVAYDTRTVRSAFGVAGTGSSAADTTYSWPYNMRWSDGSNAGYGPEGGSGPNELAYLRIAGQGCLYNVWSRLGRSHLEHLLRELRFVRTDE